MEAKQIQAELDLQRRRVDVDHFDVTIRELMRMAWDGELLRAPEYQRKFRWDDSSKSKLIESLFLGLPVPSIFVATNADGTWELVDGLQRISTLMHYLAETPIHLKEIDKRERLTLVGLEKVPSLNSTRFDGLHTPLQLAFMKRSIRVTALSDKSDPDVRFDMFERLNNGGVALSSQEVRMCIFRGAFADLLRTLADDQDFRSLVKLQEKKKNDGTREELVLKFFAYYHNRQAFKDDVKNFLNAYMKDAAKEFDVAKNGELFRRVVQELRTILDGKPLLRKGLFITPLNQLEGVMVGAADVLQSHKHLGEPPPGWLNDRQLVEFSTKGTNTKANLNGRIGRARELLSP